MFEKNFLLPFNVKKYAILDISCVKNIKTKITTKIMPL